MCSRVLHILNAFHAHHTGDRGKWLVSIYRESVELLSLSLSLCVVCQKGREKVGLVYRESRGEAICLPNEMSPRPYARAAAASKETDGTR